MAEGLEISRTASRIAVQGCQAGHRAKLRTAKRGGTNYEESG